MNTTKKALTLALLITAVAPCNATFFKSMWKIAAGVGGIGKSAVKSKPLFWGTLGFGLGKSWLYLAQDPKSRKSISDFNFSYMLPIVSITNVGMNLYGVSRDVYEIGENKINRLIENNDK